MAARIVLLACFALAPGLVWGAVRHVTLADAMPDPALADDVRSMFDDDDGRPIRSVSIDIDDDDVSEKFVPNEFLCGNGGCPWLIYDPDRSRLVGRIFASSIEVTDRIVNGHRVLRARFTVGGSRERWRSYAFTGDGYGPVDL